MKHQVFGSVTRSASWNLFEKSDDDGRAQKTHKIYEIRSPYGRLCCVWPTFHRITRDTRKQTGKQKDSKAWREVVEEAMFLQLFSVSQSLNWILSVGVLHCVPWKHTDDFWQIMRAPHIYSKYMQIRLKSTLKSTLYLCKKCILILTCMFVCLSIVSAWNVQWLGRLRMLPYL